MRVRTRPLPGLALLVTGLVAVMGASNAAPGPVAHGREISRENVGPDAADIRTARVVDGAIITDATRPDYAVPVESDALYDGFKVRGPHLLIAGVTIEGALDISTRLPVVLRGVTVVAPKDLPWLVLLRPGAGPLHVLWSDIGGALVRRSASPHVGVALALRGDGARVYRSRMGAAADGVQISGRVVRIAECEIANLLSREGDHNDAVQLFDEAADVELVRNRIENRHGQTSAITVLGQNVTIRDNVIAGGGWTFYGGARRNGKGGGDATGVTVEGNLFSRDYFPKAGSFGPVTYWGAKGNRWDRNRFDTGQPVMP